MGIRRKMAKGAFWLFLEKGAQQISSFVVFAVIARLIGPEEYGLVALCGIVMTLMNNVSSGLVDAVISMKIRDDLRLSSLFWAVSGGGAILSLVTFLGAPAFAALFGQAKITPLLQVFAVIPFLYALAAVPTALITATMNFKIFTIRTLVASIIAGIVGVWAAFEGWGAYALAFQQIVSQIVICVVVWRGLGWRPKGMFSRASLGEMLRLGAGQSGSLLLSFVESQAPRLFLGYFLGPTVVGYYAFVVKLCSTIRDGIAQPVLGVIYPALSEQIDQPEKNQKLVHQIIFVVGAIMVPLAAGIVMTVDQFVPLFFGGKWSEANLAIQIFSFEIVFAACNIIMQSIMRAYKRTMVFLKYQAIFSGLMALGSFAFAPIGLNAVVFVKTILMAATCVLSSWLVSKQTPLRLLPGFLSLWPVGFSVIGMVVGVLCLKGVLSSSVSESQVLVASVSLGSFLYAAFLFVFWAKCQKGLSYVRG